MRIISNGRDANVRLQPMSQSAMVDVLERYCRANDGTRPHLLDGVVAADANLAVINKSAAISFPAKTIGRDATADVLVGSFGRTNENVYWVYLPALGKLAPVLRYVSRQETGTSK